MPSFYIMSLFERQKKKYEERFAKAHQEIEDFVARIGNEDVAKVFRSYVDDIPWGFRLNGERLPVIPVEGQEVLAEFLYLNRREAVPIWKIRHSAFSFYEPLTPPYVFWCYGLNWHDLSLLEEDRKLPVKRVADLLEMLIDKEPHLPTPENIVASHMAPDAVNWEPTFRKKRRHLVWLFRTAVRLREGLACWI